MRKIMFQAGIRRKAVVVNPIPNRLEQRFEEFQESTIKLDNYVKSILDAGGHLIFSDESCFKGRNFQM